MLVTLQLANNEILMQLTGVDISIPADIVVVYWECVGGVRGLLPGQGGLSADLGF